MKKNKIYGICVIVLMIDQLIKMIILNNMKLHAEIKIIPSFFSILHVENEGAAFGIFGGATLPLILISVSAFFFLTKYLEKEKQINKLSGIGFGFILGGLVGNLVDRLLYGIVRDFLSFNILGYDFPVFNIADIAIVVGVSLLVIDVIRSEVYEYRNKSRRKSQKIR